MSRNICAGSGLVAARGVSLRVITNQFNSRKKMSEEEPPAKISRTDEDQTETGPFSLPWHFSDVVLLVEGRKFHAHRSTLSMWSPVFERMFSSEFREKSMAEIELPGKSAKEFEVLLSIIYTKVLKKDVITNENYEFLLKLSDEYQIEEIKKLCSDFMLSAVNQSKWVDICQVADQYCLKEVTEKCVGEAKLLPSSIMLRTPSFSQLSPQVKYEIFLEKSKLLEKKVRDLENIECRYLPSCDRLITKVYNAVAKYRRPQNEDTTVWCGDLRNHVSLGAQNMPQFAYKCMSCKQKLEQQWPENGLACNIKNEVINLREVVVTNDMLKLRMASNDYNS